MKRCSVLFIALFFVMFLSACGQSTKVYELEEDGIVSTMSFKHKKDEITEHTTKNTIPYDVMGVTSKEEAESLFGMMDQGLDAFPGISYDVKYKKKEMIQTIKIDYKKANFGSMFDFAGMFVDENIGEITSMEAMDEMLKSEGYKEK